MRRLRLEEKKKVSARRFRNAFCKEWQQRVAVAAKKQKLLDAFQEKKMWTAYMLEGPDAFLIQLASSLSLKMIKERYTLDAVYYAEKPTCWDVLIEHENGHRVEKEMWKLLMWRAPLKVLIFYDQLEEDWLAEKLAELFDRWPFGRLDFYSLLPCSCQCSKKNPQSGVKQLRCRLRRPGLQSLFFCWPGEHIFSEGGQYGRRFFPVGAVAHQRRRARRDLFRLGADERIRDAAGSRN